MRYVSLFALMLLPVMGHAADLKVEDAIVPMAPPTATVHAAFMSLTNTGSTPAQIVGVSAEGYAMAHLHKTVIEDGVASMQPVHMIEIGAGQSVMFEHGGLHVMLMKPENPASAGDDVSISFQLADGTSVPVSAKIMSMKHMHGGHGS